MEIVIKVATYPDAGSGCGWQDTVEKELRVDVEHSAIGTLVASIAATVQTLVVTSIEQVIQRQRNAQQGKAETA